MTNPRLPLFPQTTQIFQGHLKIGGCDLADLADRHGTPLYVYDQAEMDASALNYTQLLARYWQGKSTVTYAGKAFLCTAVAHWALQKGFCVDCTGAGEISIASGAGLPKSNILVHGVNKSVQDLQSAIEHAGTIVVDNLSELQKISKLGKSQSLPGLWLRFQPGSSVETHAYTQTGHSDSKFGMSREQVLQAAAFCRANDLPLNGLHFHQGSQFRDPEPLGDGIDRALDLAKEIGFSGDWHLSPGGGWGISYNEDELPDPPLEKYIAFVTGNILSGCAARGLDLPHLHLEPGRSLVARAGVAVYRVGTRKQTAGKTWLLVDGGMADNLRHALYGARYSCLPVTNAEAEPEEWVSIAGPFCESGDVLIEQIKLPRVQEDEYIAIPVCGAYHISMSSNYNGARRPEVIMVSNGASEIMQSREELPDLSRRDRNISFH